MLQRIHCVIFIVYTAVCCPKEKVKGKGCLFALPFFKVRP